MTTAEQELFVKSQLNRAYNAGLDTALNIIRQQSLPLRLFENDATEMANHCIMNIIMLIENLKEKDV